MLDNCVWVCDLTSLIDNPSLMEGVGHDISDLT